MRTSNGVRKRSGWESRSAPRCLLLAAAVRNRSAPRVAKIPPQRPARSPRKHTRAANGTKTRSLDQGGRRAVLESERAAAERREKPRACRQGCARRRKKDHRRRRLGTRPHAGRRENAGTGKFGGTLDGSNRRGRHETRRPDVPWHRGGRRIRPAGSGPTVPQVKTGSHSPTSLRLR